ncbi:MAG TPA: sugar phosphate isomerase/epimerase [Streptosporangiaceae bacterium]|jgi:inosose dehydratase
MRIAGAPISWGVCEAPGWGVQLPPERVLAEMRGAGITATEFGPDGFLPDAPADKAALLRSYGLHAVGGFVPVVLHDPAGDPMPAVERALAAFAASGATELVLAAATGRDGYDDRPDLNAAAWRHLLAALDRISERAARAGVTATLHPHVGTVIETPEEVDRVLDGSGVALCLDTGHLLVGGADPVALAERAPGRVAHAHLKDVDAAAAEAVRAGRRAYSDAVRDGMFRPLGAGDIDIARVVRALDAAGYTGWYVLEQDVMLAGADADPLADVRASIRYLEAL